MSDEKLFIEFMDESAFVNVLDENYSLLLKSSSGPETLPRKNDLLHYEDNIIKFSPPKRLNRRSRRRRAKLRKLESIIHEHCVILFQHRVIASKPFYN
jgi:hypothetical protein